MSTDLSEVIAAHEATNAKLLLRVAELEAELRAEDEGDVEFMEAMLDATLTPVEEERDSLRSQLDSVHLEWQRYKDAQAELSGRCFVAERERDAAKAALESLRETRVIEERETKAMVDAAKADAARLREAAAKFKKVANATHDSAASDRNQKRFDDAYSDLSDALSATDSAAWLESKLAERTAPLLKALNKINTIRNSIVGMQGFNFSEHAYPLVAALDEVGIKGDGYELSRKNLGTLIEQIKAAEMTIELHAEREKSLEQQLVAATNDAARAELRARDLSMPTRRLVSVAQSTLGVAAMSLERATNLDERIQEVRAALAASPDSDERLREVMVKAATAGLNEAFEYTRGSGRIPRPVTEVVDEVLRGGA